MKEITRSNRRNDQRTCINIATRITYEPESSPGTRELLAKTRDLSASGALLELLGLSDIGPIRSVEFRIPDVPERITTGVDIKWYSEADGRQLIGVQFKDLNNDQQKALNTYLERTQPDFLLKASPARFEELKDYLVSTLDLSSEEQEQLRTTRPDQLYERAETLGIEPYDLAEYMADHLEVRYCPSIDKGATDLQGLTRTFCVENQIIPVREENGRRVVALSNPYNHVCHSIMKRYYGDNIDGFMITEPKNIQNAFDDSSDTNEPNDHGYRLITDMFILDSDDEEILRREDFNQLSYRKEFKSLEEEKNEAQKSNIIDIVNKLLISAIKDKVSDIHIEPREDKLLIRFRQDGVLKIKWELSRNLTRLLMTRIKIMGDMDIAERRKSQDGGFSVFYDNRRIDVRASILPVNTGEKGVLRVLDKQRIPLTLDGLGFNDESRKLLEKSLRSTKGILYFTGPTGSGKTTTMYTCLKKLSGPQVNIQTVEDPIEYNISDVNQTEVNPKAGLTFSSALRGILRQDPDILMIGEIRDKETLDIAAKAAMSGHLVLSTLHTNDAASSIERLLNIGMDAYTVATTTRLVVAQRLLRVLCTNCKQPAKDLELYVEMYPVLGDVESNIYTPEGCKKCGFTGYRGQMGVMECIPSSETFRKAIQQGLGTDEIQRVMTDEMGLHTLYENAFQKVSEGKTSVEEALRITMI